MHGLLTPLQQQLEAIYSLDAGPDVADFLIHTRAELEAVTPDAQHRYADETVLLRESDDGVDLALYLADDVLDRLSVHHSADVWSDEYLNDLWLALEGISHFSYLVHRLGRDNGVSLLELELQAEVDKFVATWFLAKSNGHQGVREHLWQKLFVETTLADSLSAEESERYVTASRYAAHFCAGLALFDGAGHEAALRSLRDFYRLDRSGKVSEIHRQRLAD